MPMTSTAADHEAMRLTFEVTERCNLACSHCYLQGAAARTSTQRTELDTARVGLIIEAARSIGCRSVRFTGGEPLLRSDFPELYRHARSLGLDVSVNTNATLMSEEVADLLAESPPKLLIVSLYGWDAASYDQTVNCCGAYPLFAEGVARLRRRGIPFQMNYPAVAALVSNRARLLHAARTLGASAALPCSWDLSLQAYRDPDLSARIAALRLTPKAAACQRISEFGVALADIKALQLRRRRARAPRIFACRDVYRHLVVSAFGELLVCPCLRHPDTLYDLVTGSLQDAVERHIPALRKRVITSAAYHQRCQRCILLDACPRCAAKSWTETGTLDEPADYYCRIMHEEAILLGVLRQGENGWDSSHAAPVVDVVRRETGLGQ